VCGADAASTAFFRDYQLFLTLLKVDVQFAVSLVLMVGFFLVENDYGQTNWVTLSLAIFLVFLSFGHAFIGWMGVRHALRHRAPY
jgi:hypothetical protein